MEINRVRDACAQSLMSKGFEVPARGRIYRPLGQDVLGWVGLSATNAGAALVVRPNVGVHHVPLMKLVSALQGAKYVRGDVATYAISLDELAPGSSSFTFLEGTSHVDEANRLAQRIVDDGLPWMGGCGSLSALIPLLKRREGILGNFPERVAVALLLQGRRDEALTYLRDRQCCYDEDAANPEVATSWRRFSNALQQYEQ